MYKLMRFLTVGVFLCGFVFQSKAATLLEALDEAMQIYQTLRLSGVDEAAERKQRALDLAQASGEEVSNLYQQTFERDLTQADGNALEQKETLEKCMAMEASTRKKALEKLTRDRYSVGGYEANEAFLRNTPNKEDLVQRFFVGMVPYLFERLKIRFVTEEGELLYPSTIPGYSNMPDIEINRKIAWRTRINWGNEMAIMKLFAPWVSEDLMRTTLGPFQEDKNHGSFFTILEAYLRDIVEEAPLPDHWEHSFRVYSIAIFNNQIETLNEQKQALIAEGKKIAVIMGIDDDGNPVVERVSLMGIKLKTDPVKKTLERVERWLKDFSFLGKQEEEAIEALKQYRAGSLASGQWRVEREVEERAAAKKKKESAKKKEREKRKKSEAHAAKEAAEEAERVARLSEQERVAAQVRAERKAAERAELERLKDEQETLEKEAHAADIAEAMAAFEQQREKDRAAKRASKTKEGAGARAAAAEEEDGARAGFSAIQLNSTFYSLMDNFWRAPTMRWVDFRKLFASDEMGFALKSPGGSIRKFVRKATDDMPQISFIAHEPHESYQSDSFGPSILGHFRNLLNRRAGWSFESFSQA